MKKHIKIMMSTVWLKETKKQRNNKCNKNYYERGFIF